MARPTKAVVALSEYSQTKAELRARQKGEEKLKGKGPPEPSAWLTEKQREIFGQIVGFLAESEMLCINDGYMLEQTAIAIDRLSFIEKQINDNPNLMCDREMQSARNGYIRDFYRGCNELCLSPQARAKLANAAIGKEKLKPIEEIIKEANE